MNCGRGMKEATIDDIENPEIRKLCKSLERLPEFLAEKRRKAEERREFCRYVFEQACRDAGLLDRKFR
jgi:hypothetical protein